MNLHRKFKERCKLLQVGILVLVLLQLWNDNVLGQVLMGPQRRDDPMDYDYDDEPRQLRQRQSAEKGSSYGNEMNYDQFKDHWPPKKPDGTPFDLSDKDKAMKEWEELLQDAIEKYNDRQSKGKVARPIPFCVDGYLPSRAKEPDNEDPALKDFKPIIEKIVNDPGDFQQIEKFVADPNGKSPGGYVEKIIFKSVISPNAPNQSPVDVGIGRLNQWVHIVIETNDNMQGIFIQGISGPVGLPFGNFRDDFTCTADASDYDNITVSALQIKTDGQLIEGQTAFRKTYVVPCKYRSRASVRHPTVYAYKATAAKRFRVHFNWEDIKCSNAPRMQFLIVAVKDFAKPDYEVFFTQAYEQSLDSGDGIPYPYFFEWHNRMKCEGDLADATKTTDKKIQFSIDPMRSGKPILYNYEYDLCITDDTDLLDSGCPPGPFHCTETGTDELTVNKELHEYVEKSVKTDCNITHCAHPNDTIPVLIRTTTPGAGGGNSYDVVDVINRNEDMSRQAKGSHGHLMILSYMMLMEIGIFGARFYKETSGLDSNGLKGCLGISRWLWGHIIIFFAALAALWMGLAEVIQFQKPPIDCDGYTYKDTQQNNMVGSELTDSCKNNQKLVEHHKIIGSLSVVLFHAAFFTGWFRPLKTATRVLLVNSHTLFGYLSNLIAIVSVFVFAGSDSFCLDVLIEVVFLVLVNIGFFVGATFIQRIEDKKMGIIPRKQFPIVDALEVKEGGYPCDLIKIILMIAGFVIQMMLYLAVFFTYLFMYDKGNVNFSHSNLGFDMPKCIINPTAKLPSAQATLCLHLASSKVPGLANLLASHNCNRTI